MSSAGVAASADGLGGAGDDAPSLRWTGGALCLRRPRIMGVLNVTPDSFSDGGRHVQVEAAVAHARRLERAGADLIDVGGESTRPGAEVVPEEEELRRVIPVIRALREGGLRVPLSVDTTKAAVADAALEAGASIVNDISGLSFAPEIADVVAARGAALIVMHTPSRPATMNAEARYADVVATVRDHLLGALTRARAAGIAADALMVDPGFGFGKERAHNRALLARLPEIAALGAPVLVGMSRKRMLRELLSEEAGMDSEALEFRAQLDALGTAAALLAFARGAHVARVHEPAALRAALALREEACHDLI